MAEGEVACLKDALYKQYVIMKKLYDELEEEREASSSAASEALSMILRLQREKAAEKMEAAQYKRMAEEKMHHVEESLEVLEEVMQEKEMEIASLMYQLQACQRKLSSIGVNIPNPGEFRTYRSPSLDGDNTTPTDTENTNLHGAVRRNISLPSLLDQLHLAMDPTDGNNLSSGESFWRKIGDYTSHLTEKYERCKTPDLYEESAKQAEEVTKKMRVLIKGKNVDEKGKSSPASEEESSPCSWYSPMATGRSYDPILGGRGSRFDSEVVKCLPSQAEDSENIAGIDGIIISREEAESNGTSVNSPHVHDIYEIQEIQKDSSPDEPYKEVLQESIMGTKKMIERSHFMPQEAIDYLLNDDVWSNMQFMNNHTDRKLSKPPKGPPLHLGKKPSKPKNGNSRDYPVVDTRFGVSTSQNDSEELKKPVLQFKDEKLIKQENSETGKEQLKLLQEIHQQLSSIETHLKKSKSKKIPSQDELSLSSVIEAVLSFSL